MPKELLPWLPEQLLRTRGVIRKPRKKANAKSRTMKTNLWKAKKKEEEESFPSHSDIEKSVGHSRKTEALRKQLEAEVMTQKQLGERIAELKRKNKKSNKAFAELQSGQFDDEEELEELRTPKITKRRKLSMRDDLVDAPKVICVVMSGKCWCGVF